MVINRRWVAAGAVAAVVVGAATAHHSHGYQAKLVVTSAAELAPGSPVWINGRTVGHIDSLGINNGKAVVTVDLDKDSAPLHDGTTSRVEWVSAVGERVLTLYPGKTSNAEIPSGSMLRTPESQVEVDQVLQTLNGPTRARLNSVISEARSTLSGHESDTRQTLKTAGQAADALGNVLAAVGQDGPAIRTLITELSHVTASAAQHQTQIASTVQRLDAASSAVAGQQSALSQTLKALPGTLSQAQTTLAKVPDAANSTVNLLHDLQPATSQLPSVSANLAPLLRDVRPTVAQLRPLMFSAATLLRGTPGLLDTSHAVLPTTNDLLSGLAPAISFLRPYTPDGVGGLVNWGQAFAPYDGAGHTWAGLLAPGVEADNESTFVPPTSRGPNRTPAPGTAANQPWTDATGSTIR